MRVAKVITLSDEERTTLVRWSRGRSTAARLVLRAKIVLAAAEGRENKDIAAELGCTRRTVGEWRNRFAEFRLEGIERDAPRGGRAPEVRARMLQPEDLAACVWLVATLPAHAIVDEISLSTR